MACLHCTTHVLRVFLPDSVVSLRASRALPSIAGRRPNLLRTLPQRRTLNHLRRTSTITALRPLTDDDHIPFVPLSDEFLPSAVREKLKGATAAVNPVGPPPPPPVERSLDDWDIEALMGIPTARVVKRAKPVAKEKVADKAEVVEAEAGEVDVETTQLGELETATETTNTMKEPISTSAATEMEASPDTVNVTAEVQQTEKENRASLKREKYYAALNARKEAQKASWEAEKAEKEQGVEVSKDLPLSKNARKKLAARGLTPSLEDAVSRATHAVPQTARSAELPTETTAPQTASILSRGRWKLPEVEDIVPEKLKRIETHIAKTPRKELEPWVFEKAANIRKLGGERWDPKKKLSPEALDGIRALHAQDPERFSTPQLARLFEVTPEAIRRILKSKWRPKPEEAVKRDIRWMNRGHAIFEAKVESGEIIPKSRKNREKKERNEKEKIRRTLEEPIPGGIGGKIF